MKILFLSQGLPFPVYQDGLTVRVYHLLREFAKHAEVHLIAFGDHELTTAEAEELRSMASYDIINYQPPKGITGLARKVISNRRYFDERFVKSIQAAIKSFKPDIAFCEQTFMAQYADVLNDLPKVMSAVDAISLAALRQATIGGTLRHFLAWRYVAYQRSFFEKKYFPEYDRITAVSQEDANFLSDLMNREVLVISNGVDTDYYTPKLLDDARKTILFTGNLSAPMNEDACIYLLREVFPGLHAKHPEIKLEIAGRAPTARICSEKPNYVDLNADMPDLRDAYKKAILCVSPIAHGTGIKNNILQAMAMGIPVVVSPLIARPIQIVHNETGFVAERGQEFLETLKMAVENPSLLGNVGGDGRLHIEEKFSWQHVSSCYMNIFSELLSIKASQNNTNPYLCKKDKMSK